LLSVFNSCDFFFVGIVAVSMYLAMMFCLISCPN
jgi:hypothetical protein